MVRIELAAGLLVKRIRGRTMAQTCWSITSGAPQEDLRWFKRASRVSLSDAYIHDRAMRWRARARRQNYGTGLLKSGTVWP